MEHRVASGNGRIHRVERLPEKLRIFERRGVRRFYGIGIAVRYVVNRKIIEIQPRIFRGVRAVGVGRIHQRFQLEQPAESVQRNAYVKYAALTSNGNVIEHFRIFIFHRLIRAVGF